MRMVVRTVLIVNLLGDAHAVLHIFDRLLSLVRNEDRVGPALLVRAASRAIVPEVYVLAILSLVQRTGLAVEPGRCARQQCCLPLLLSLLEQQRRRIELHCRGKLA